MSTFSHEWLQLREPADHASRSVALTAALVAMLRADPLALAGGTLRNDPVRVVDIGAGTGSNLRYLAGRIGASQRWRLVDEDAALLEAVPQRISEWAGSHGHTLTTVDGELLVRSEAFTCRITTCCADVAVTTSTVVSEDCELVTASALLDLVSESWLAELAGRCAERQAAVLFALTYDGRIRCAPAEPEDELVRDLVNRHQATDKGFGPALGGRGAERAAAIFGRLGYEVRRDNSDWMLDRTEPALQTQLIAGWADAACEMVPAQGSTIRSWQQRRTAHVTAGRSAIVVGHEDLCGWPSGVRSRG